MYKLPYTGAEIEERLAKLDDLNAENIILSEETADLYGLSGVDANVDKALEILYPKQSTLLIGSTVTANGLIPVSSVIRDDIGFYNSNSPERIATVPLGVTKIKIKTQVYYSTSQTGAQTKTFTIYKNGVAINPNVANSMFVYTQSSASSRIEFESYEIDVLEGDYFSIYGSGMATWFPGTVDWIEIEWR